MIKRHLSKDLNEMRGWAMSLSEDRVFQTEKSKCKGPGEWVCSAHWRSSKEASAGLEWTERRKQVQDKASKVAGYCRCGDKFEFPMSGKLLEG